MSGAEMGHADVARTLLRMLTGEWSDLIDTLPQSTLDHVTSEPSAARLGFLHGLVALLDRTEPDAPVGGRALYRDKAGDLWIVGADGEPYVLEPEAERRRAGSVWHGEIPGSPCTLAMVERDHGPLHVVPWPGEVR